MLNNVLPGATVDHYVIKIDHYKFSQMWANNAIDSWLWLEH